MRTFVSFGSNRSHHLIICFVVVELLFIVVLRAVCELVLVRDWLVGIIHSRLVFIMCRGQVQSLVRHQGRVFIGRAGVEHVVGGRAHVEGVVTPSGVGVVGFLDCDEFHFEVVDLVIFEFHFFFDFNQFVTEPFDFMAHFGVDFALIRQFL